MKTNVTLTVLYDNEIFKENLKSDWGFACHIKIGETNILFDTGDNGSILLSNMQKLGIDPKEIEIVFLSHYHHDHTGGLTGYLEINPKVKVYFPQSFPQEIINTVKNYGADPIPVSDFKEIVPDAFILGEFTGNIPEQAMVIKTVNGLVVITGCAHPGIVTILDKVKNVFPDEPVHLVLGGFHLYKNDALHTKEIADKVKELGILKVAPCHCSGTAGIEIFKNVLSERFIETGVGRVLKIPLQQVIL